MLCVEAPKSLLYRIPPDYQGRWRMVISDVLNENGTNITQCTRAYGSVFED